MCDTCGPLPDATGSDDDGARRRGLPNRRAILARLGGLAALGTVTACGPGGSSSGPASPTSSFARVAGLSPGTRLGVVLLGTQGGPPVDPERSGISTAVVVDGATYVVDCGRASVTQYVRSGLRLGSLRAILLTHLHADHIADYFNYFLLGGNLKNALGDNLAGPVAVVGPGPAGGLPTKPGGGPVATVAPADPTPGTAAMTDRLMEAFAYSSNVFLRDTTVRDIRTLADVREVAIPQVGASYFNTAPPMAPFQVYEDDRVRISAILVPHGPVFPAFAYRFDSAHGSVTLSGDTTLTPNIPTLARGTDLLIHEAINVRGVEMNETNRAHLLESHVQVQDLGGVAQAAGAKALVLSHISGNFAPIDTSWQRAAQQGFDGRVSIGTDLQTFVVA